MAYDLLIQNATIVDGTGAPRRSGGVAVQDGLIQAVGEVSGDARRVIDAHGQVVAPGFIDPHTHMDFFLKKYPAGLPVVNYGVTTIVICDCGASCAPVPPKGPARDILMAYLHRVLDKYVDDALFTWTTYEEYLDSLEGSVGVNVGAFVPHSPLRLSVMGEEALQRTATPDEQAALVRLVQSGWDAGAIGFSSSPRGGPLLHSDTPSTFASREEMLALAGVVAARGGVVQFNGFARLAEDDSDLTYYVTHTPARMLINEYAQAADDDESGRRGGAALARLNAAGHQAYGVVVPYQHIRNYKAETFYPLEGVSAWEALPKEPAALAARLADPALRAALPLGRAAGQADGAPGRPRAGGPLCRGHRPRARPGAGGRRPRPVPGRRRHHPFLPPRRAQPQPGHPGRDDHQPLRRDRHRRGRAPRHLLLVRRPGSPARLLVPRAGAAQPGAGGPQADRLQRREAGPAPRRARSRPPRRPGDLRPRHGRRQRPAAPALLRRRRRGPSHADGHRAGRRERRGDGRAWRRQRRPPRQGPPLGAVDRAASSVGLAGSYGGDTPRV